VEEHRERKGYERRKDSAEKIRELLRSDGTAEDIVAAFKEFKTQDRWLPDTRGERLHTRNAVRRLAGDYSEDRVYDRKLKAEVGDRCVGVAVDLSGSMSGINNLRKPKLALGALHLATKTIGDDLLATGFKTYKNHPQVEEYEPVLDLITGPQEGFDWGHLDGAKAGLYTPTADGIMYTLDLLKRSHRREKVLVVVTDGKGNIPLGGSTATNSTKGRADAKRAVNTARQEGVKVLGMAVGNVGEQYMDEVLGAGKWVQTGSDTLTQDLVELYRSEMRTGQQRRV
jgi:Mg-chelatase subunit ChlD